MIQKNKFLIIICFICYSTFVARNESDNRKRIFNGFPCSTETHPFMVMVFEKNERYSNVSQVCGGTLINPTWVLSAAHCYEPDGIYEIMAGINNPEQRPLTVKIEEYFIHPSFDPVEYSNDIALMKLQRPIEKSNHIDYIELPTFQDHFLESTCAKGLIVGWGRTFDGEMPDTDNLQCAIVPMLAYDKCRNLHRKHNNIHVPVDQICTLSTKGVDACDGDSGGPLICNSIQIGIVSWGVECGLPDNPGVYTKTAYHLGFIYDTIYNNAGNDKVYLIVTKMAVINLILVLTC